MRKPIYTPGPWFADGVFIETEGGIMGRHIATVAGTSRMDQANAFLIAAAPDLRDALRALLAAQEALDDTGHAIEARHQNDRAEAVAVALLARLDGSAAEGPESESLSGPV